MVEGVIAGTKLRGKEAEGQTCSLDCILEAIESLWGPYRSEVKWSDDVGLGLGGGLSSSILGSVCEYEIHPLHTFGRKKLIPLWSTHSLT